MISIRVDIASEIGSGGIQCDVFDTCVFVFYTYVLSVKTSKLKLWWDKKKKRKCTIRNGAEGKEGIRNVNARKRK